MRRPKKDEPTPRLWIEPGEQRQGRIAEVAPLLNVFKSYSFAVPEAMEPDIRLGQRVLVPVGGRGRLVRGFVTMVDHGSWDDTLRPIAEPLESQSYLTQELISLGREISAHYACPLGITLKAMTAEGVRKQRGFLSISSLQLLQTLDAILADGARISQRQRNALETLTAAGGKMREKDLRNQTGISPAILRTMRRKGWIEVVRTKDLDAPDPMGAAEPDLAEPDFALNDEQSVAVAAIHASLDARQFRVNLLFGVSGSGKTEVYIRAMQRVLGEGRQAILLVPEIVLTTQLVKRLTTRLPNVAINHSGLTDAQRSVLWHRVASGEKQVVIGTRSAVFAPCPSLGLIVVDEEQEPSFKNQQAPRFHVRDVAIMRAKNLGIPVVLGSATPALETWYHSQTRPDYTRLSIQHRVKELPLPRVHIVDMKDELLERPESPVFARTTERLLAEAIARKEQAILLMNRRGFANRLCCPKCNTRISCPNCNVGLVSHSATGESLCHYCRARIPTPTRCPNPSCREKLISLGHGTQRVEEELKRRFPSARIARADSDTMRHPAHYQRIVDDLEARQIDVIVGTQMIAKGLDFPGVSFVGVLHADGSALAGDFRAHERLFQLVTQVAGRAGRAEKQGEVVVQTMMPELPAFRFALHHDYMSFAEDELASRREVRLPPFSRIARVILTHSREERAHGEAESLVARIVESIARTALEHADVVGPNPCVLSRLRGRYRYDLLIRTATATDLRKLLSELIASNAMRNSAESTVVDVDPVSMW